MSELDLNEIEQKLSDGWIKGEPYVFVSYASANKEKVFEAVLELRKRGINVYVDVELQENISKNWMENIKERLFEYDCKGMVSFLSIDYMRSYACFIEQLMISSDDMIEDRGEKLPNFYISLDGKMGTPQGIKDVIYGKDKKVSEDMRVAMVPEERTVLQAVMENNSEIRKKVKESGSNVSAELDKIKTKHNVVTNMFKYFFWEKSVSIQLYKSAKECANLLFNNFTNEKNDSIALEVLEELKEKYGRIAGDSKVKPKETPIVKPEENKDGDKPVESSDKLLYYEGAAGKENGLDGIIILKNSKISIKEVASCPDAAINKRKNAIENNLLISDGNYYILQEDMEFKSLSGAACFVSGTSVNGKTAWKTTQKQTSGHKSEAKTAGDGGISSKINQICMVVRKVKEEPAPIDNYTKTLAVIYGDVAAELNIGKSSVVDKCQRQLNLSAMEFAKYLKDFIDSGSDKLHEIVLNQAKNQEERELIDKTFAG